jgi:cell filamentation protein
VLKNVLGLRDANALAEYEAIRFGLQAQQPLPSGRFSVTHYRAVHRHLFGDVYRWAGRYRTVRIRKDMSMFCYPEHIAGQMDELFGRLQRGNGLRELDRATFTSAGAAFLAGLNAIHPFREGNGRTQTTFLAALAASAGHPLNLAELDEDRYLKAMIRSFQGDLAPLREALLALTR